MSVRRLPRELGLVFTCNGTTTDPHPEAKMKGCEAKFQTANIMVKNTRTYLKTIGWGRGLRKGGKRRDHCPKCMPLERAIEKTRKAEHDARKVAINAARKANGPGRLPKKSRGSKSASPTVSPSAEHAPAPAL